MLDQNTRCDSLPTATSSLDCVAHFLISAALAVSGPVLALLGLANATSANAANSMPRSQTVQFGDLDLVTPAGIAELERRVKLAAREVCETSGLAGNYAQSSPCVAATRKTAMNDLAARQQSRRSALRAQP